MGKFKSKTGKSRVGTAISKIGSVAKKAVSVAKSSGIQGGLAGIAAASAKKLYSPKPTDTKAVGVNLVQTKNTQSSSKQQGITSDVSSASGVSNIQSSRGSSQIVSRERTQPVIPATIGEKPVVDIPTAPVDKTDYLSMIPQAPQTPLDQFQAQQKTDFETMMEKLVAPPSTENIYAQAQKESGILQKQAEVNRLSEQLNMIQSTAQANQLKTIGQGRGIPEAILGGQQAQIGREAAIAALPVSAQLQAAQGNLEMAEQNLNTLFSIRSADARAKYEYKNNLIKSVYDFASGQQKQKLDYAMKLEDRKYQEEQANIAYERTRNLRMAELKAASSSTPESSVMDKNSDFKKLKGNAELKAALTDYADTVARLGARKETNVNAPAIKEKYGAVLQAYRAAVDLGALQGSDVQLVDDAIKKATYQGVGFLPSVLTLGIASGVRKYKTRVGAEKSIESAFSTIDRNNTRLEGLLRASNPSWIDTPYYQAVTGKSSTTSEEDFVNSLLQNSGSSAFSYFE